MRCSRERTVRLSSYMVNRFRRLGRLSNRWLWISGALKGSLSAYCPCFQKDSTSTAGRYRRLRSVCACSVRYVVRRDPTRRTNYFPRKHQKSKIERSQKEKMQKVKSKSSQEMLTLQKRIAEAREPQSSQSALNLPRSPADPLTEMPGSCGALDVPRYIFPLVRPPYMKRVSPSLPDGPSFLKKVRCGLNLEQR
jgi:hypothetical protein